MSGMFRKVGDTRREGQTYRRRHYLTPETDGFGRLCPACGEEVTVEAVEGREEETFLTAHAAPCWADKALAEAPRVTVYSVYPWKGGKAVEGVAIDTEEGPLYLTMDEAVSYACYKIKNNGVGTDGLPEASPEEIFNRESILLWWKYEKGVKRSYSPDDSKRLADERAAKATEAFQEVASTYMFLFEKGEAFLPAELEAAEAFWATFVEAFEEGAEKAVQAAVEKSAPKRLEKYRGLKKKA